MGNFIRCCSEFRISFLDS